MYTDQQIKTMLKKAVGIDNKDWTEIFTATVFSVDKTARTCNVTPISGRASTDVEGVFLSVEKNDGELKVPAIDSTVFIGTSDENDFYVIGWSDLQEWLLVIGTTKIDIISGKIIFGDGSFDGLAKVVELTSKLNKLENDLNAIKSVFLSGWIPVPNDGGAALKAAAASWAAQSIAVTSKADIENQGIVHGTT